MEKRKSISTISSVQLNEQNQNSSSTAELQPHLAPGTEKAKTTKYLDKVLRHNLHRFVLALYLLAIGIALVVVVFTNDPDHRLREYYGIHDLISVPLTALIITGLWVKVYLCVRHMRSAITTYRADFALDPSIVFTGMKMPRWKKALIRIVMLAIIGVKISFLVTMIVCLKKACSRLPGNSVDTSVVVLFSLALVGSVAIVITMIEAAYTIILLMRPQRALLVGRMYPVLIYEHATDEKPVLLL